METYPAFMGSLPRMIRSGGLRGIAAALAIAVAIGSSAPPARSESSEKKLVTVTKTTIYGALLGGLLGLTSALIVKRDSRDDVIRWGVAVGAFSGFVYGIVNMNEGPDDLSGAASTREAAGTDDLAVALRGPVIPRRLGADESIVVLR